MFLLCSTFCRSSIWKRCKSYSTMIWSIYPNLKIYIGIEVWARFVRVHLQLQTKCMFFLLIQTDCYYSICLLRNILNHLLIYWNMQAWCPRSYFFTELTGSAQSFSVFHYVSLELEFWIFWSTLICFLNCTIRETLNCMGFHTSKNKLIFFMCQIKTNV